jgi:hypothetical protein
MTREEARAALIAEKHLTPDGRYLTNRGARAVDETLAHLPALIAIYDVILAHPNLTVQGFDNPRSADFDAARVQLAKAVDEFEQAVAWLRTVPRIATPKSYSYRLAQEVDVSHGAFLAACLHLGIPMKRLSNASAAFVGVAK